MVIFKEVRNLFSGIYHAGISLMKSFLPGGIKISLLLCGRNIMELMSYVANFYQWERGAGKKLKDKLFALQRFQDVVIPKFLSGDIPH